MSSRQLETWREDLRKAIASAVLDFEGRYGYRLARTPSASPTQPLPRGSLLSAPVFPPTS